MLCMLAGLMRSLILDHGLPGVGVEYNTELNAFVQARGYVAALPQIRSAARIDFDNEAAVTELLAAARRAGDALLRIDALVALAGMKPEDAPIRNELVSALLGQGRVGEALAQGRFAVHLSPDLPAAHCNLGAALLGLGRNREAAAAYRQAIELDPESQTARLALEFPLRGF